MKLSICFILCILTFFNLNQVFGNSETLRIQTSADLDDTAMLSKIEQESED